MSVSVGVIAPPPSPPSCALVAPVFFITIFILFTFQGKLSILLRGQDQADAPWAITYPSGVRPKLAYLKEQSSVVLLFAPIWDLKLA